MTSIGRAGASLRIRHLVLGAFLAPLALAAAGCAAGDASGDASGDVEVVRRDSAGVAIVENRGVDQALDWRFEEVLRLGGADEGPEAFFRAQVAADRHGRIYVLDAGEHHVAVFDSAGRHLRTFGAEGGGPGEMEMPARLVVTDDGTVGVQDWGKSAIVRWDSAGRVLEQVRLTAPMLWDLQSTGAGLAGEFVSVSGFGEAADSTRHRLVRLAADDADPAPLATAMVAPGRAVDFGCVRISSMAPLFQPELAWTVAAGRFVIADDARYELELRDGSGALVGLVRRDVEPEPATEALAAREVGDSMRVGFGGGRECVVPPETVVDQRGYDALVPAVRNLYGTPGGGWWIARGVGRSEERSFDVFASDGAYVGTLPSGTPYPNAFLSDDLLVTIERDEVDLPYVVVYRIGR